MSDDENRIVVGDPKMMRMFYPKPPPKPKQNMPAPKKSGRFFGFNPPKLNSSRPRTLGPVTVKPSRRNGKNETTVELNVRGLNRPFIYGFVCVMIGLACLTLLAIFGVFSPLFSLWGI